MSQLDKFLEFEAGFSENMGEILWRQGDLLDDEQAYRLDRVKHDLDEVKPLSTNPALPES